tara:strand:+ start:2931 stop:3302 length:372 start_codon:yes stop_codon:yes gene_type:complete
MNKRRLRSILKEALKEVGHLNRLPDTAVNNDTFIPAGTLEDILEMDGFAEFKEELAMMCEMLENGDQTYFIMEPAEHKFIRDSMLDMAEDGDPDFDKWLERSGFESVFIGDEEVPSMIQWTMP